jgi:hypothetical protein
VLLLAVLLLAVLLLAVLLLEVLLLAVLLLVVLARRVVPRKNDWNRRADMPRLSLNNKPSRLIKESDDLCNDCYANTPTIL